MSPILRNVGAALLICAVVAATHAWMLDYPLILDDYSRLEEAQAFDRSDFLLGGAREPHTVFRPVLWATQRLDHALWGWWIPGHHASSIFWHALTCLLLWAVVRELVAAENRLVALAAALLFAVHPAKSEAVVWIAARGSILPATFGLLAVLLQIRRRKGRAVPLVWPVLALVLAFLSKESSVGFAGAVIAVDVLMVKAGEGRRTRWLDLCVYFALPLVLWGARRLIFGEDATRYLGWYLQLDRDTIMATLESLPEVLRGFALGTTARLDPDTMLHGVGVLEFVPAVLWLILVPWRRSAWRAAACQLVVFLAVATPTAFVARVFTLAEGEHPFISRLVYPASVVFCAAVFLPILSRRESAWRKILILVYSAWIAAVVFLLAVWQLSDFERRIDLEHSLRSGISSAVRDAKSSLVTVEGLPGWLEGIAWSNYRPPFHDRTIDLEIHRPSRIEDLHRLFASKRPVAMTRWDGRGIEVLRRLPSRPSYRVFEVRLEEPGSNIALPGIEPRAAAAFELDLVVDDGEGPALFDIVLVDGRHRRQVVESGRDPRFSRGGPLVLLLDDRLDFLDLGALEMVAVHHRSGPRVRLAGLRTLATTPAIESIAPGRDAVIPSDSSDLVMRFRDPGEHPIIRLGFRLGDHVWSTTVWRSQCTVRADGSLALPMDAPDVFRGAGGPSIKTLLTQLGVERIEVFWWVDGLDGQIFHRSARSEVRRLTVVR